MSTPALRDLHADLEALDGAIAADDLTAASRIMSAYDHRLRRYMEQAGQDAPLGPVRRLLRTQDDILSRMRGRQNAIGDALLRDRRAVRASQAYARVGMSP